ncbi:cytochrome c1 [Microvirga sp. W0021]|uniref:Cytochrome c1 n=1 Tax=Hohaiivirga grylli TaxID=3133970 RepID=A0ABV0BJB7_9HYPH
MTKKNLLVAGALLATLGAALIGGTSAKAAEGAPIPPAQEWSFSGAFGTFDRAQLQRGFKVYREVCSACHGLKYLSFRNLAQPGGPEFSEEQVKALAAEYQVTNATPNDEGEIFQRPGRPADRFPSPFANDAQAAYANGGKAPPDLSLMGKARTYERGFPLFIIDMFSQYQEQAPDYIHAIMTGYVEHPPEGFSGVAYNKYFLNNAIAMVQPLHDGQVEYPKNADGRAVVPETIDQYGKDVAAFLVWAADPHMEARKRLGMQAILFLIVMSGLMYFTKKKIWKRAHAEEHA